MNGVSVRKRRKRVSAQGPNLQEEYLQKKHLQLVSERQQRIIEYAMNVQRIIGAGAERMSESEVHRDSRRLHTDTTM